MTNGTKNELISHRRIAAETNSLLLFPARFAHAHYSSGMIDRFPNWGDDGKPNGGKIKGRCQPPPAAVVLIYYTSLQMMRHTCKFGRAIRLTFLEANSRILKAKNRFCKILI